MCSLVRNCPIEETYGQGLKEDQYRNRDWQAWLRRYISPDIDVDAYLRSLGLGPTEIYKESDSPRSLDDERPSNNDVSEVVVVDGMVEGAVPGAPEAESRLLAHLGLGAKGDECSDDGSREGVSDVAQMASRRPVTTSVSALPDTTVADGGHDVFPLRKSAPSPKPPWQRQAEEEERLKWAVWSGMETKVPKVRTKPFDQSNISLK